MWHKCNGILPLQQAAFISAPCAMRRLATSLSLVGAAAYKRQDYEELMPISSCLVFAGVHCGADARRRPRLAQVLLHLQHVQQAPRQLHPHREEGRDLLQGQQPKHFIRFFCFSLNTPQYLFRLLLYCVAHGVPWPPRKPGVRYKVTV